MFDVASVMQEVLYALFQGYCLQYFLGAFLESRFPKSRWISTYVIIRYGALRLGVNLLIPSCNRGVQKAKGERTGCGSFYTVVFFPEGKMIFIEIENSF